MEQNLPKSKKLKSFRQFAKSLIDSDSDKIGNQNEEQEEKLRNKIKDLQHKYPHVDFTQLYDTERAENTRKALHKQAFASYKAYEFLKNGVQTNN